MLHVDHRVGDGRQKNRSRVGGVRTRQAQAMVTRGSIMRGGAEGKEGGEDRRRGGGEVQEKRTCRRVGRGLSVRIYAREKHGIVRKGKLFFEESMRIFGALSSF